MSIAYSGEFGLPNTLREKMLSLGKGEIALLMDAMLFCGFKPGRRYTRQQVETALQDNGITASAGLIWRALSSLVFRRDYLIKARGRPQVLYRMPFPDELRAEYNVQEWLATDTLVATDFSSLKTYRLALHRELIKRRPGEYSRARLAGRLGIGKRTTANYDKLLGVTVAQQFRETRLWDRNFAGMVAEATPGKSWLKVVEPYTGEARKMPAKVGIFHKLFIDNYIYLVTQKPNYYSFESEWVMPANYVPMGGATLPY
jgi:hypothetical protein